MFRFKCDGSYIHDFTGSQGGESDGEAMRLCDISEEVAWDKLAASELVRREDPESLYTLLNKGFAVIARHGDRAILVYNHDGNYSLWSGKWSFFSRKYNLRARLLNERTEEEKDGEYLHVRPIAEQFAARHEPISLGARAGELRARGYEIAADVPDTAFLASHAPWDDEGLNLGCHAAPTGYVWTWPKGDEVFDEASVALHLLYKTTRQLAFSIDQGLTLQLMLPFAVSFALTVDNAYRAAVAAKKKET